MNIRSGLLNYSNKGISYSEGSFEYNRAKKADLSDAPKVVDISKLKDTGSQIKDFFRLQRYINDTIENIQKSYTDIQKEMLPSLLKLKNMVFKVVKNDMPLDERLKIQNEVTEIRTKINEVFMNSGKDILETKGNIIRFPGRADDISKNNSDPEGEGFSIPELSFNTHEDAVRALEVINNLIASVERKMTHLTQKKEENVTKLGEMGTASQRILGDENRHHSWDEMQKILAYTKQKMFADANQALEAQGNFTYRGVVEVLG